MNNSEFYRTAHENAQVPFFFQQYWAVKKGENPLDNEEKWNQISSRADKLLFILAGFYALTLALAAEFQPSLFLRVVIFGIIFLCLSFMWVRGWVRTKRHNRRWHFQEYYNELSELFELFDIRPSTYLGKLSKEDFAGLVAGSLRAQMRAADEQEGFARLPVYSRFVRMHAKALFWELCDPEYGKYDPKKQ